MKVKPAQATEKQLTGASAEARAEALLIEKGLHLVERNYNCKLGEIDLIMQDKQTLVFVEVRYRKNAMFGSALDSVSVSKQKKIIAAAQHYLLQHNIRNTAQRFDVVGITGSDMQWVTAAFQAVV